MRRAAAVLVMLAVLAPTPAVAGESEVDQRVVEVASREVPTTERATNCHTIRIVNEGKNAVGLVLWTMWKSARWCWRHGRIIDKSFNVWAASPPWYSLWRYDGISATVRNGNRRYVYHRTHAKFHKCVTWICQDAYPWISMTLRPKGSYTWDAGR